MDQSKKLLIIGYYFPPNDGVGGRRWAKFSSLLAKKGVDVTVLTTRIYSHENSLWEKDIDSKVKIIRMDDGYPTSVLNNANSIGARIKYKLDITRLKKKYKGNIYDVSALTKTHIQFVVKKLVENKQCKNIIVSGAPFSYFTYVAELKKQFPEINLILDYRDLWTDSKYHFGGNVLATQGNDRFMYEQKNEQFALDTCDEIFAVSRDIQETLSRRNSNIASKTNVIPNGFDENDGFIAPAVSQNGKIKAKDSKKIVINYYGTINCGVSYSMKLLSALDAMINRYKDNIQIEVNFYGNTNKNFANDVANFHNPSLKLKNRVGMKEMKETALDGDFLLYIKREDELPNSFATKFYDYIRLRKFIIIMSPEGDVTNYIRSKEIGLVIDENKIDSQLHELFFNYLSSGVRFNSSADISDSSIEEISKLILNRLK